MGPSNLAFHHVFRRRAFGEVAFRRIFHMIRLFIGLAFGRRASRGIAFKRLFVRRTFIGIAFRRLFL